MVRLNTWSPRECKGFADIPHRQTGKFILTNWAIKNRVGRLSYLAQQMIAETLRINVTAPNGEPICVLPLLSVARFAPVCHKNGLSLNQGQQHRDNYPKPWDVSHVLDFVTQRLGAQVENFLRASVAHEQRKFDELNSLIERAAEEETERRNVDREALGESAESRAAYPYTALAEYAVSDRGEEGMFLLVWGATPITSRCGLAGSSFRSCDGRFFEFPLGGAPISQVVFVPQGTAATNTDEDADATNTESCPSARLGPAPEDPAAPRKVGQRSAGWYRHKVVQRSTGQGNCRVVHAGW